MAASKRANREIPSYFRKQPPLLDDLESETSIVQAETLKECVPLLNRVDELNNSLNDFNEFGIPSLDKKSHGEFLHDNLDEFPAPFVGLDASRPWLVYWALLGLYLLGEDISVFRSR